jgi:hypothetical protein
LASRSLYLLGCGLRLQAAQRCDVPAHRTRLRRSEALSPCGR